MSRDVFICDAVRTPIGRFGGALAAVRADDLGAIPLKALLERNPQLDPEAIDDVFYGCANQAGEDNRNVARMSLLLAGLPETVPGVTLNRLCASGLDAVGTAFRAAEESGLDPLLVLAVISVESRFNPIAESGMGARGLMQIIPKYHLDKLAAHGGEEAVLDPESNIAVGTQILREYVRRTGSLEAGLQYYNGAAWDEEARYTSRVLSERRRLALVAQAVHGARAGI